MRRMRTAAAFTFTLLITSHAAAEEPAWKRNIRRDQLYKEGQALVKEGQWEAAVEKFQAVIELRSEPRVLLWTAFAEEKLGHLLKAQALYATALEGAKATNAKSEEEAATQALDAVDKKIPRIVIQLPPRVELSVVLVDGTRIEVLKEGYPVDPGKHDVKAAAEGREPFETEVTANVGENHVVTVTLPIKAPSPVAPVVVKKKPPTPPPPVEFPTKAVALTAVGSAMAIGGAVLVGFGMTRSPVDGAMEGIGVGIGITGLMACIGGIVLVATSGSTPASPKASHSRPSIQLAASPTTNGGWIGMTGQF